MPAPGRRNPALTRCPSARPFRRGSSPREYTSSTVRSEDSTDRRCALSVNQRAVRSRRGGPASWMRTIAAAIPSAVGSATTTPLTPSWMSSTAALSSAATTMLGVPRAAASTTTMP